jgi:hypothetical protein
MTRKAYNKSFGPVICPKCGKIGILIARVHKTNSNIWGPYFYIQHTKEGSMVEVGETADERIIHCSKLALSQCYLGKLSVEKLDEIVKNRPWPIDGKKVVEILEEYDWRYH